MTLCLVTKDLNEYMAALEAEEGMEDYRAEKALEYTILILAGEEVKINGEYFSFEDDVLENLFDNGEALRLDLAAMNGTLGTDELEKALQIELDLCLNSMVDQHIKEMKSQAH